MHAMQIHFVLVVEIGIRHMLTLLSLLKVIFIFIGSLATIFLLYGNIMKYLEHSWQKKFLFCYLEDHNQLTSSLSNMNCLYQSDWLFGDLEDKVAMLRSEDSKESTPVSSMSEELLAKAHQLGLMILLSL